MTKRENFSTHYQSLPWIHKADLLLSGVFLLARNKIIPRDRRKTQTAHFIRDRRKPTPRISNLAAFVFIQGVMGLQAFILVTQNKSPLGAWLFVSYFFALLSFILYKSLNRILQRILSIEM